MTLYLNEKARKRSDELIKIYLEKLRKTIPDLRKEITGAKEECNKIYC